MRIWKNCVKDPEETLSVFLDRVCTILNEEKADSCQILNISAKKIGVLFSSQKQDERLLLENRNSSLLLEEKKEPTSRIVKNESVPTHPRKPSPPRWGRRH